MSKLKQLFPPSFLASLVFLLITLVGVCPMVNFYHNPGESFEGYGRGIGAVFAIMLVTFPCCGISALCGLSALKKTRLAYLTLVPSGVAFAYLLIRYLTL